MTLKNSQKVRHLNSNYIYFSLKETTEGKTRTPERKQCPSVARDANPAMAPSEGLAVPGFSPGAPTNVMGVGKRVRWQVRVRPAGFTLITGFSHIYSLKVISYFK